MNIEETQQQRLQKHLTQLSTQKRGNIRKMLNSVPFQNLIHIVEIFKPSSAGGASDVVNENFCIMRLGEMRGWESYDSIIKGIINYIPPSPEEDISEEYQEPGIQTQTEENL